MSHIGNKSITGGTHDNQHPGGGTGELVTMTDEFNVPFSSPSSLGANTLRVDYTGGQVFI
ncbi:MAG: hypothetical protein M3076_07635 [Actinomycetota bacterium]|nr:hypothetical protein [Actinomycetota bacterium]